MPAYIGYIVTFGGYRRGRCEFLCLQQYAVLYSLPMDPISMIHTNSVKFNQPQWNRWATLRIVLLQERPHDYNCINPSVTHLTEKVYYSFEIYSLYPQSCMMQCTAAYTYLVELDNCLICSKV